MAFPALRTSTAPRSADFVAESPGSAGRSPWPSLGMRPFGRKPFYGRTQIKRLNFCRLGLLLLCPHSIPLSWTTVRPHCSQFPCSIQSCTHRLRLCAGNAPAVPRGGLGEGARAAFRALPALAVSLQLQCLWKQGGLPCASVLC